MSEQVPYETVFSHGTALLVSRVQGVHQIAPLGAPPPEIPPSRAWIVIGWDEDPCDVFGLRVDMSSVAYRRHAIASNAIAAVTSSDGGPLMLLSRRERIARAVVAALDEAGLLANPIPGIREP